MYVTLFTAD